MLAMLPVQDACPSMLSSLISHFCLFRNAPSYVHAATCFAPHRPRASPFAVAGSTVCRPQPLAAAGGVAQQSWFGVVQDAAASQAAPPVTVLGVLGGGQRSRQDFAILLENGQKIAVRAGDKTPGGWLLLRVNGGGVVLRQPDGSELNVALSRQAQPDSSAGQTPAQQQLFGMPATQPAMQAPAVAVPPANDGLPQRDAPAPQG